MRKKAFQKSLFQYVFDASSLINIERNRKMGKLRERKGDIVIPEKVADEVNIANSPLSRLITSYPQIVSEFLNNEEMEYLLVRSQSGIHDGEAAAIAISIKRNLPLVIEDKKGKEKAEKHGIRALSWEDFIKRAN